MDIKIEPVDAAPEISRVSMSGRIDAYTVARVQEDLNSLIRIGTNKLVCNLKDVEFVASPGMKALLETVQAARKQGGDMKICHLQPEVAQLFSSSGFAAVAKVFATEEEALKDFGVDVGPSFEDIGMTLVAGSMDDLGATLVADDFDGLDDDDDAEAEPEKDAFGLDQTIVESPILDDDDDDES